MKKRYAYSGTHGVGKSTAAMDRGVILKKVAQEKSVHILADQEALCPFSINKDTTPESQLWIFTNQIRQELIMSSRFDILVLDRTIVDVIAYTKAAGFDSLAQGMMAVAENYVGVYSTINVRLIKNNPFCFNDGIREASDLKFRHSVEDILLGLYSYLTLGGYIADGVVSYG